MLGVVVAIAAQGALYLALRHLATAYMPAWAHHLHHRQGPLPWPTLVGVDVVKEKSAPVDPHAAPALPPPVLMRPPVVVVPPPELAPVR